MNSVIYNIPSHLFKAFAGRRIIVRSHDAAELVQHLAQANLENVLYVQLLNASVETEALTHWGESVALDISVKNPVTEFPLLYNFSKLLDKHPVRISIPVTHGFSKAVRLALALNFAVKLEVGQPDAALIEELSEVLDLYLHRSTVLQPVEYFHSTFLSFYHQQPSTLWLIQEEDPEQFRFITDSGMETVSRRFGGITFTGDIGGLFREQESALPVSQSECDGCEFLEHCGGYFKWPDRNFNCEGVKTLFGTLKDAAEELGNNLNAFQMSQGRVQPL